MKEWARPEAARRLGAGSSAGERVVKGGPGLGHFGFSFTQAASHPSPEM
jgi:hypothetical protein